ncbi:MAG: hypothetical protein ABEI86_07345, partial [Halobacteriaceae archaeon]
MSITKNTLIKTKVGLSLLPRRSDTQFITGIIGVVYLVIYSWAVGNLSIGTDYDVSLFIVDNPLQRMMQSRGFFSFEPIARLKIGPVVYLFSPLDFGIALILATLVALNVGLVYLLILQPTACGIESSVGILGAIP